MMSYSVKTSEIVKLLIERGYSIQDLVYAVKEAEQNGILPEVNLEEEKKLDERIKEILVELGIAINYNGYRYLVSIVKLQLRNPNCSFSATSLYNTVAKQYGTTPGAVEKSIRTLSGIASKYMTLFTKMRYFGGQDKISTKRFYNGVTQMVKTLT